MSFLKRLPLWKKAQPKQKKQCLALALLGITLLALVLYYTFLIPVPDGKTAFLTFYGFNDNDNGAGKFGTAVIAYPASSFPATIHNISTGNGCFANDCRGLRNMG
jgi:hypothetical protein